MATTTNYGWTTPDDTALVKDGASAIRALGTAIDTSMNTALGTKKSGLVLLNTTSFSAVASQSVNDVFSSTYDNYRILITQTAASTTLDVSFRLRVSGSDDANAIYQRGGIRNLFNSATVSARNAENITSWGIYSTQGSGDGERPFIEILLKRPFAAAPTSFASTGFDFQGALFQSGVHTGSTSFTGFTIIASTGNITGSVNVFGVNK